MELTESPWKCVEPLLPEMRWRDGGPERPPRDRRTVLNGILWVLRTGAPWKDLPDRYPSHQTCHRRFQPWCRNETLDGILEALAKDLQKRGRIDLTEGFIDGSFAGAKKGALAFGKTKWGKSGTNWRSLSRASPGSGCLRGRVSQGLQEKNQRKVRVLDCFDNMEEEANRVAEEVYDRIGSAYSDGNGDMAAAAETALEHGQEFYMLLSDMKTQTTLGAMASLYHQWEKDFREFMERELPDTYDRDTKSVWRSDINKLFDTLKSSGGPFVKLNGSSFSMPAA